MSFTRPELLPLALLLPAFMALAVWAYARRRQHAAHALGERGLIGRLGGGDLFGFPVGRLLLVTGAAASIGIAASGPQWGTRVREGQSSSLSAVLALDISKSMFATDVAPDRLERERIFARRMLRELPGDRLGLVVFAGRAYVLAPLTVDHSALQLYLDALDPEIVSQGGSSLAAAIRQATDLARGPSETGGDRAVILVTDGEAHDDEAQVLVSAEYAAEHGVTVHTVGVGTTRGSPIPEKNPRTGAVTGYKRDEAGEIVVSRLNETLLREVANRTGGTYVSLEDPRATSRVVAAVDQLQRQQNSSGRQVERVDRYGWFVLLALLLLAADTLRARRSAAAAPVRARVVPPVPAPAANAALVLLVMALNGFGVGDLEKGNRLYRAGRYAEAVEAYRAALRDGDESPQLQYNLGTALLRLGRYEEAERHLRVALDAVEPELRQRSLYNLGNRFLSSARSEADLQAQGQLLQGAIDAYKRSLRLTPEDVDAKWNLEMALRDQEQNEQQQQQQQSQGGQQEEEDEQQDPSQGGSGSGSASGAPDDPRPDRSGTADQQQMTQEQAERILSAVEQDERDLTREKLQKGQRRTPVRRDW